MPRRSRALCATLCAVVLATALATPRPARSHGDWGHIHVTAWAIENLPPGPLKDFFRDPGVFNAALYGAAFPDTGYWIAEPETREFAEYSHWEPFVESFIQLVREEHPPPFWSPEEKMMVAFLLGCAAHGLQDEIFDSLFLHQVDERDGHGQDEADGGTDFFLITDGHHRFTPERYVPLDTVLRLYAEAGLPYEITEDTVVRSMDALEEVYINDGLGLDLPVSLAPASRETLPWTQHHYLDPDIPGSLVAEIYPTMRHLEALWERLHGRWTADEDLVVHVYPDEGRTLRSPRHGTVDSWVTMILGKGLSIDTAAGALFDPRGGPVASDFTGTRWGHPFPRVLRFQPTEDLAPSRRYGALLEEGAELIGGEVTTEATRAWFRTGCEEGAPGCGWRPSPRPPRIDGSARHTATRSCLATTGAAAARCRARLAKR